MSTDTMHPNLKQLSYSAMTSLEACPRAYELDKLSPRHNNDGDVHLNFGKVLGIGVQHYMVTNDLDASIFKMFLAWSTDLFDVPSEDVRHKKSIWYVIHALEKFVEFRSTVLHAYDVVTFEGVPATELGFSIDCDDGFHYRGSLDGALINKFTKQLAVLEIKTTNSTRTHPAMYQNSMQGIGYIAILDAITHKLGIATSANFPVIYPVYKTVVMEWEDFTFYKSRTKIAEWIQHVLRTIQHVSEYAEQDYFPRHGQSCYNFFRPCRWFDTCDMSTHLLVGKDPEHKIEAEDKYQFKFTLLDIIAAQLEK